MKRLLSLAAVLALAACAPLRAGTVPTTSTRAALAQPHPFDFTPPPECVGLNAQRSNWGAAGKVAGAIAGACVAGGGVYAAASRDGLGQGEAVALASCAALAGGVVVLSVSKAESLAQTWAGTCTAPRPASSPAAE